MNAPDRILQNLNPRQREAVAHEAGPLLITAGAGSGKTRVIIHRIAHLIAGGAPPHSILALTFTNKAADEMRERAAALIGQSARHATLSTFHSFCYHTLLRHGNLVGLQPGFTVYDDSDQKSLIKACIKDLNLHDTANLDPARVHNMISFAKNFRQPAQVSEFDALAKHLNAISGAYEAALLRHNAVDFDNLILKTLDLLEQQPDVLARMRERYLHILVDEYQDTNHVQFLLLRLLAGQGRSVTVVGDENQSIYRWRGADITNILSFEAEFKGATVVALEQNYRSSQRILDAANSLIRHNRGAHKKRLWSELGEGEPVRLYQADDHREEANFIADEIQWLATQGFEHGDMALLCRTRAQTRIFEDVFPVRRVPYTVVGITGFYQRKEIKDILAYLRLVANPRDMVSLQRIVNTPRRGMGAKSVEKLVAFLQDLGGDTTGAVEKPGADSLPPAARAFLKLIDDLRDKEREMPLRKFIKLAADMTGYSDYLESLPEIERHARRENVEELGSVVVELETAGLAPDLVTFLQRVSLVSDADGLRNDASTVKIMTLHCAKGLEFPVLFLTGVEEGLLPHASALGDPEELNEERRLCYVGVTRAMQRLYITHSRKRLLFGRDCYNPVSRFIKEMEPEKLMQVTGSSLHDDEPGFLDEDEEQPPQVAQGAFIREVGGFTAGDMVEHEIWGKGRVVSLKESEICVAFDNGQGVKRLAIGYAPLRKV